MKKFKEEDTHFSEQTESRLLWQTEEVTERITTRENGELEIIFSELFLEKKKSGSVSKIIRNGASYLFSPSS